MILQKVSVLDSYQGRHILLTGATGFLGKVLLAMMLKQLPNIHCVYVLIRIHQSTTVLDRFIKEILASPIFRFLAESEREAFIRFVSTKIKLIEGNVSLPHLGIKLSLVTHLYNMLDLIINVAGLVDFSPDIQKGVEANVVGALRVGEFANACKKAKLIHISTCYVAGHKNGVVKEELVTNQAPNGQAFHAEEEFKFLQAAIQNINAPIELKKNRRKQALMELGQSRALKWGWSNSYCYTKALAEILLTERYRKLPLTIVRPSIIESAHHFPFAGWNEGFNTSAPLAYALKSWYPFFVAKKNYRLDFIPVDMVSSAIILIGSAALNNKAAGLYQLASSKSNPCYVKEIAKLTRAWHAKQIQKNVEGGFRGYLQSLKPLRFISPHHPLAPAKLIEFIKRLESLLNKMKGMKFDLFITKVKRKLKTTKFELQMIDKIYRTFLPFVFEHDFQFVAEAINHLVPDEIFFRYDISAIDWKNYWFDIHMPGINQWIFPLFNKGDVTYPFADIVMSEEELVEVMNIAANS